MNPARSLGPDVAIGNLSTWWVYLIGPVAGAAIAVPVARVLRGPAKAQEAEAAQGTPLDRMAWTATTAAMPLIRRSSASDLVTGGQGDWQLCNLPPRARRKSSA